MDLLGLGRGGEDLVVVGDVAVQEVAADLVGDRLPVGVVHVEQDGAVAPPYQLSGDLGAEAGGTAGDERDLAHASTSSLAIRSRCWEASPYWYSRRFARLK